MTQHTSPNLPNRLPDDTIRRTVNRLIVDGSIASCDHRSSLGSTNTEATEWLREFVESDGSEHRIQLPRLIITDSQTAGRGRLGRDWTAQEDGLAFSLLWAGCHPLLSIAVGVAIAEAIEFVSGPASCGLKWPNDIWMNGRKVGGVLIERVGLTDQDHTLQDSSDAVAIIGIGINVGSSPDIDDALTTSVLEATGKVISPADLLAELIPSLIERLAIIDDNLNETIDDFAKRCVLSRTYVRCWIQGKQVEGICDGISQTGELRVRTDAGIQLCRSGEVTRVRHVS